ncbi:hypothetical protein DL98DRAFT_528081 [Cadophora sp. DSE1049]|nr:hypothetical protein DL98DRAFT_528081 [Cadophora sp. DSE1049]
MLLLKTLAVVAMAVGLALSGPAPGPAPVPEAAPGPAPNASPVAVAEPDPRAEPISDEKLVYVLVPVARDGDTVVSAREVRKREVVADDLALRDEEAIAYNPAYSYTYVLVYTRRQRHWGPSQVTSRAELVKGYSLAVFLHSHFEVTHLIPPRSLKLNRASMYPALMSVEWVYLLAFFFLKLVLTLTGSAIVRDLAVFTESFPINHEVTDKALQARHFPPSATTTQ